jgi:hypothetical protein
MTTKPTSSLTINDEFPDEEGSDKDGLVKSVVDVFFFLLWSGGGNVTWN